MDRRGFVRGMGLAAASVGLASATAPTLASAKYRTESPQAPLYRALVPEIFAPLPDPPEHTEAIVIGSGFGAAVSALRLAQAGVRVSVLERGSRWPNHPWREIFASEGAPDGRGFWHLGAVPNLLPGDARVPMPVDSFGGVLCVDSYRDMGVLRGAAVGGGSVIFTGVMIEPEQRFFDSVFRGLVDYKQMHGTYYPRVRKMLRLSPMPEDIYQSAAFAHSRAWDAQARAAGYHPQRVESNWNWSVIRDELHGRSRPSATIGRSNLGNSNGAKFDLNQNYLRYAEDTGRARVFPGHRVDAIAAEPGGRFSIRLTKLAPTGQVLRTRTVTCDRLYLGAGSIGTSELLVRARATGAMPRLNGQVGEGWGTNGDAGLTRTISSMDFGTAGAPCASRILDEGGVPTSLESWYVPGPAADMGLLASLGMVLDPTRGRFEYRPATDSVELRWPNGGSDRVQAAATAANAKAIAGSPSIVPPMIGSYTAGSAHPLGGAVLGRATDGYGRVHGYRGLYVVDGAAMPGSSGTVNPSLTITALAERNIEQIIRSGG